MSELNIIPTNDYDEAVDMGRRLDMPLFNSHRHVFIEMDTADGITLSVNFNGTPMTLSFVPRDDRSPECVDIMVQHDQKQVECNPGDERTAPIQKATMFHGGLKRVQVEGALLTVLVHPEHLQESASGYGDIKA